MKKYISILTTTALLFSATLIVPTSYAGMGPIKVEKLRPKCFKIVKEAIEVPFSLTKKQKDLFKMIKANSEVIQNIKLGFVLENRIITCLQLNYNINGFEKLVLQTFAAYPSMTNYSAYDTLFNVVGKEKFSQQSTVEVNVSYEPKKGYTAVSQVTKPIKQ
jgi:hypothetical protein